MATLSGLKAVYITFLLILSAVPPATAEGDWDGTGVFITNLTSTSVSVVAYSGDNRPVKVAYSTGTNLSTVEGEAMDNGVCYVVLTDLEPHTVYNYSVTVGGKVIDSGNLTTPLMGGGQLPSRTIFGRIVDGGGKGVEGVAVVVGLGHGHEITTYLSTLSGKDGYWIIDLSGLTDKWGNPYMPREGDIVRIWAVGGNLGHGSKTLSLTGAEDMDAGTVPLTGGEGGEGGTPWPYAAAALGIIVFVVLAFYLRRFLAGRRK